MLGIVSVPAPGNREALRVNEGAADREENAVASNSAPVEWEGWSFNGRPLYFRNVERAREKHG